MNWFPSLHRSPILLTLELYVWLGVCIVGLALAARRLRSHPLVARTAIAAFAILSIPCFHRGLLEVLGTLHTWKVKWAFPTLKWLGELPFVPHISQILGFALLTVAIFAGRKPVRRDEG